MMLALHSSDICYSFHILVSSWWKALLKVEPAAFNNSAGKQSTVLLLLSSSSSDVVGGGSSLCLGMLLKIQLYGGILQLYNATCLVLKENCITISATFASFLGRITEFHMRNNPVVLEHELLNLVRLSCALNNAVFFIFNQFIGALDR
uniref:Uncharacterized protein n=1 Tax=Megaselia scalaris TaxID=36166 RepID=T1GPV8_MEGSC